MAVRQRSDHVFPSPLWLNFGPYYVPWSFQWLVLIFCRSSFYSTSSTNVRCSCLPLIPCRHKSHSTPSAYQLSGPSPAVGESLVILYNMSGDRQSPLMLSWLGCYLFGPPSFMRSEAQGCFVTAICHQSGSNAWILVE